MSINLLNNQKYKLILITDENFKGRVTDNVRRVSLFVFLPDNGSGEGGCQLCLKIIQFGLQGQNCVIDLFLVVSVNPGNGEDSNPAKSYNGEAVHDGAKISQEIHGNSELENKFYFF